MISRDNRIAKRIDTSLSESGVLDPAIKEELDAYARSMDQKRILRKYSVGWCISTTTTIIASASISTAAWKSFALSSWNLLIIMLLAIGITYCITLCYEKLLGQK